MEDRIRKIISLITPNEDGSFSYDNLLVFYEDERRAPANVPFDHTLIERLASDQGLTGDIEDIIVDMQESGQFDTVDTTNMLEVQAALDEFGRANDRAEELGREPITPVVPVVTPTDPTVDPVEPVEEQDDGLEDPVEEIEEESHLGRRVLTGVLAGASLLGAAYGISQLVQHQTEKTADNDMDQDQNVDINFDTASFQDLMDQFDENDPRRVTCEDAYTLVQTFHTETHKDNNFRVVEDAESYLDLSYEEALVLCTFANYSEPAEIYSVLGDYGMTSTEAQDILESAREKMITYYMNAQEPSGLANIFHSEQDREFFQNFEQSVLRFNQEHTTEASDDVIRDVYYNYILDGATNSSYDQVSPLAKLLSFDAVYGGLNLVESASTEHTQFLEFHGNDREAETRYYIQNILGLDYSTLSEEQIETYSHNIIESGTKLVDLTKTNETMTEDNSTQEELDATKSVTELVDKMGLCNAVNTQIAETIQGLDTMQATQASSNSAAIVAINDNVSQSLRAAGHDDLASRVDASISTRLSDDLLEEIRTASNDAAVSVENYEGKLDNITGANKPTVEQIINAAERDLSQLEHYAGHSKDVATLINNRRHVTVYNYADENGYMGRDEDGIPIYDSSIFDDMTDDEIDDFIRENGEVIDEETETHEEEVNPGELTDEEQEEARRQIAAETAANYMSNYVGYGQVEANEYANSTKYDFGGATVTNQWNGEVMNLDGNTFNIGNEYMYAFGGSSISTSDAQIQADMNAEAARYVDSISQEDRELIALGLGTDWAGARAQLIAQFQSGYTSQMNTEINGAITAGTELRKQAEDLYNQAMAEIAEEEAKQGGEEQPSTETPTEEAVEEGEETPTLPSEEETGTGETDPAPAPVEEETGEEEYDPNIGEQFEEGEELIEDANGNNVRTSETAAAPAAETVTEEATPAAAPVEETESKELTDADIEAIYEAQLAQEAAEAEASMTESGKTM